MFLDRVPAFAVDEDFSVPWFFRTVLFAVLYEHTR